MENSTRKPAINTQNETGNSTILEIKVVMEMDNKKNPGAINQRIEKTNRVTIQKRTGAGKSNDVTNKGTTENTDPVKKNVGAIRRINRCNNNDIIVYKSRTKPTNRSNRDDHVNNWVAKQRMENRISIRSQKYDGRDFHPVYNITRKNMEQS